MKINQYIYIFNSPIDSIDSSLSLSLTDTFCFHKVQQVSTSLTNVRYMTNTIFKH